MAEIEISEEAREVLLARLQAELEGRPELRRRPVAPGLKLCIGKNSAHLALGFPGDGDRIETYKGKSVLIISAKDFDVLAGVCMLVRRSGSQDLLALERK